MRNKITTKVGDNGGTFTITGDRVPKDSDEIEFIGTLDELQSFIGILPIRDDLTEIQRDLYRIMGGEVINASVIDDYISTLEIPNLKEFILPRGWLHITRTVCRRAERCSVRIDNPNTPYLNRLSDFLYILSFNIDENGN